MIKIHPSALISSSARVGEGSEVGPFSIVHGGVEIMENTFIGSNCEIGITTENSKSSSLIIGSNSYIRSHSVFYSGSTFGNYLETGHGVVVRENCTVATNVRIGTNSDLQGDLSLGNYVRVHSNVFIAKRAKIEDYVWLFPGVVITDDPHPPSEISLGVTINKFAVVAARSTILPGVTIGSGALVGANSLVNCDVPKETLAIGNPVRIKKDLSKIKIFGSIDVAAYPWRKHFHRGYPEEVILDWINEFKNT
jgi:acetyltransferase-like isoleucine patch superfamily enzyme